MCLSLGSLSFGFWANLSLKPEVELMGHTILNEPILQLLQRFTSSWQLCPSLRWPTLELEHCLDSQAGLSCYFLSSLGPQN